MAASQRAQHNVRPLPLRNLKSNKETETYKYKTLDIKPSIKCLSLLATVADIKNVKTLRPFFNGKVCNKWLCNAI